MNIKIKCNVNITKGYNTFKMILTASVTNLKNVKQSRILDF